MDKTSVFDNRNRNKNSRYKNKNNTSYNSMNNKNNYNLYNSNKNDKNKMDEDQIYYDLDEGYHSSNSKGSVGSNNQDYKLASNQNKMFFSNKKKWFFFIFLFILAVYFFNNSKNNNNIKLIDDDKFENFFSNLKFPNKYGKIGDTIRTHIYINNIKKDKRPISILISSKNNTLNDLINYFYSFNNPLNLINNSIDIDYILVFNQNEKSQSIRDKIKYQKKNKTTSNIYIFKIDTSQIKSGSIIDFGPIEDIIDGSSEINVSRNNLFLFLSDVGQTKEIDDDEKKREFIIGESKLIFQHRFLHRIRSTLSIQ
ncbi:hypothetical protein DICPUDRAFT_78544 [Dictyostelium purpureum]|uniref:Uncharacterized protein n=1 Tax=Dictyostelium purpureum TaxID=5786 RepID=F0ZJV6_DICPU|nr:uncharacterized protein DICPUDRAFT_78544 [Dictyostelium purpureum]EGC35761.1 hypothetical protein DICPUDRAFT_78544 [Dictyostelium purpureum]|eukprot:XP_003287713.1 hypothetical protein DICPUDRAFT_78544 [Dictyostelium purpureum]